MVLCLCNVSEGCTDVLRLGSAQQHHTLLQQMGCLDSPSLDFIYWCVMLQGFIESIGSFGVFAACYNC